MLPPCFRYNCCCCCCSTQVKFWRGDPPPVFCVDGVNYLFIKKSSLYFVATSRFNVSPSFVLEVLERLAKVFKDYCGVLSEESIRKNFILIYELLDEMLVRPAQPSLPTPLACLPLSPPPLATHC